MSRFSRKGLAPPTVVLAPGRDPHHRVPYMERASFGVPCSRQVTCRLSPEPWLTAATNLLHRLTNATLLAWTLEELVTSLESEV